jgi:hypothetical protein
VTPGNEFGCKKIGCNAETWTNAFMDCSSPFSLRRANAPGFAKTRTLRGAPPPLADAIDATPD